MSLESRCSTTSSSTEAGISAFWRPGGCDQNQHHSFLIETLRGFGEEDLDQLLWHVTTIDAAVGKQEQSSTRAIKRRVAKLLSDGKVAERFTTYYDIRSGYVHGRQLQDPNLWQRDLAGARRLARRVAYETFKLASDNRPWTRADVLKHLDS